MHFCFFIFTHDLQKKYHNQCLWFLKHKIIVYQVKGIITRYNHDSQTAEAAFINFIINLKMTSMNETDLTSKEC